MADAFPSRLSPPADHRIQANPLRWCRGACKARTRSTASRRVCTDGDAVRSFVLRGHAGPRGGPAYLGLGERAASRACPAWPRAASGAFPCVASLSRLCRSLARVASRVRCASEQGGSRCQCARLRGGIRPCLQLRPWAGKLPYRAARWCRPGLIACVAAGSGREVASRGVHRQVTIEVYPSSDPALRGARHRATRGRSDRLDRPGAHADP